MNSDTQSVFDYIFGLTIPGVKLELSRVETFMAGIGDPFNSYPIAHIAGTNGKGSTSAMLASILGTYGNKTGLFTSPHLIKPNERIRIGNQYVPDDFLMEKVEAWRPEIDRLGITFFELLTALGMCYFKEQSVDYAVIETGLGGRLDATNVVDPLVSVITSVSMDHENILGDDLAQIASEKAGIIKAKRPVVLAQNSPVVARVVNEKCLQTGSICTYVPDVTSLESVEIIGTTQHLRMIAYDQLVEVDLPFLGLHQIENFANVLVTLHTLGFSLNSENIQKGLDHMEWPGRMQVLQKNPLVLYDVAHNPSGLEQLLVSLKAAGMGDALLVVAFNARKNIGPMLELLEAWEGQVLYSAFEGHSALEKDALLNMGIQPQFIFSNLESAYMHAQSSQVHPNQSICFLGSHYMGEELFRLFHINE